MGRVGDCTSHFCLIYNAVPSSLLYTRGKDASIAVAMSICGPSGQQLGLKGALRQALGTIAYFQELGDVNLQKTSVSKLLHVGWAYSSLKTQPSARVQGEEADLATGGPVDEDEGRRGPAIAVDQIIG